MPAPPITRIVLYKHGVGYFEREGQIEGDSSLTLSFRQAEVSDVLKSLIVLDLDGGHIANVSYDSTKPLEQLLAEVALSIPDRDSLAGLLPQLKGTRITAQPVGGELVEGLLIGLDRIKRPTSDEGTVADRVRGQGVVESLLLSLLDDSGRVQTFDLLDLGAVRILDDGVRRDLDFYLRTQLSAKKKDARGFTILARGEGKRTVRLAYTVEAPVWKATYRLILGEEGRPPTIQGWAVVDNTQEEDWNDVELSLVAGLPVSFVHDLYTPRFIRRPEVQVQETTGVLPPIVEEGMPSMPAAPNFGADYLDETLATAPSDFMRKLERVREQPMGGFGRSAVSSAPAQVRERKLGDLFAYDIEHKVTIRRNQSALVPIVLREFKGRPVLLYNKANRAENPMRCVEFENTTGLTLEGGPVTVLEGGDYVGEAMLETVKPDDQRLVPYAVELSVRVTDSIDSHEEDVTRVVIRRGSMTFHYARTRQTTYTFHNKSDSEQVVYLEHPHFDDDWDLFDTPEPVEITENHWRFRFPLPARQLTTFLVHERTPRTTVHTLADLNEKWIGIYFQKRYFDARIEKALKQALDLRKKANQHESRRARLQVERNKIFEDQARIRENLQSLGDRASEKGLRERFVRGLDAQENRLAEIDRELEEQNTQRDQCQKHLDELLESLEFEAVV